MSFFSEILDPVRRFERQYAESLLARGRALPLPGDARVELDREFIPVRGLGAAMADRPRLVLTGAAGMGKTTALAHLALVHARAILADEHTARIPIWFSARDLSNGHLPAPSDLPRALGLGDALTTQCPKDYFANALASGRALVLIDDLDALAPDAAAEWLANFATARLVATAHSPVANLPTLPLPGFRDNDIERALRNWGDGNPDDFLAQIKSSRVPRALTGTPLTLALLVRLWRARRASTGNGTDQPLPVRRTPLFDAFAEQVLGDSAETLRMLEGVALGVQRGHPAPNEFLPKSRGFLRPGNKQTSEFVHPLWQSYFAARALHLSPDRAPILERLDDPAWQEVVAFYAGMGQATDIVEALTARGEYASAGHVLAHAAQVRADLREAVTAELVRRAWDGEAPATAALSEMGSDAAVEALGARLKDKDPAVRARAAGVLGELQLDRGIEYLLPQLRDVDGNVRDHVLEALGKSRTDRVIEPLLVALRGDPRVGTVDTRLRVAAAKALGQVGSDRAVTALIVDLQVGEPEVRAVAAESLKRITSPLMLKPLAGILESGDADARKYATDILAVVNRN